MTNKNIKSFYIKPKTDDKLDEYAELEGISRSSAICRILNVFFDEYFRSENQKERLLIQYDNEEKTEIIKEIIKKTGGKKESVEFELSAYLHVNKQDLDDLIDAGIVRFIPRFNIYKIDRRTTRDRQHDKMIDRQLKDQYRSMMDEGKITEEHYKDLIEKLEIK